MRWTHYSSG